MRCKLYTYVPNSYSNQILRLKTKSFWKIELT